MKRESLWATFWSKVGAVGIRTKIMGIVAVSILCSGLVMVWYTYQDDAAALRYELQERGIAIGSSLAAQSRDFILTDNQFALYTLVESTRDANEDLAYTFVLDAEGNVLVHTFDEGFPTDLLGVNYVQAGETYGIQAVKTEDDMIQDIAVPVLGGKAGVVRLGMSESSIRAAVVEHIRNILLWLVPILVLGITIAYGLASILTIPITKLAEAARAVGRGDFRWKSPVWAKDEIGSLGTAFNEMSEELRRKDEMRVKLLAKVIDAQEEERKRISRELHDETSQSLTSLMVGLKVIEDTAESVLVRERTAELRGIAARTLNDVHNLAMELRPSLLDDLGLASAVQTYIRDYSSNMDINVDLYVNGIGGLRLPPEIELTIYRIVQEALTNIAKHAEARNVSVVLRSQSSSLVTIIEDDGKGFDINETMRSAPGKLGLFGMHERASLAGGELSIESARGVGTTIILKVPLDSTQDDTDE
jgi:signal transduction histidine kinase